MDNKLVDYYYDKIMHYLKKSGRDSYLAQETKDRIKLHLVKIINNNLEYLLTDSLIYHMSDDGVYLHNCLLFISEKNESKIFNIIYFYFRRIIKEFEKDNENEYTDSVLLLSDDIKKALSKYFEAIKLLSDDKELKSDIWYYENTKFAFECLLTLCFINKSMDTFNDKCDKLLKNHFFVIDDLRMNGILMSYEHSVRDRVKSMINSLDKNVIR